MTTIRIILGFVAALVVSCAPAPDSANPLPSAAFVTATMPSIGEPSATQPAGTAVVTVTPTPIAGSTTTQVNVREEPSASGRILGTLAASATVDVLSRDPAGNWYQIAYEAGDGGRGWVASQYVRVPDPAAVPLVSAGGGPAGSVREQINVRSGPGTQFDAVGMLSARDVVTLTGRDRTGAWLKIRYAGGVDGSGWVAASFLEAAATDTLPVVTETGETLGTATPTVAGPKPTPPPASALEDGDSATAPAVDARFSPTGLGSVFYSSDLSTPTGDNSDWIQFTPYYDSITVRLDCRGDGELVAEVMNEGAAVAGLPLLECGTTRALTLRAGNVYVLHLSAKSEGSQETYLGYTVSLFANPAS